MTSNEHDAESFLEDTKKAMDLGFQPQNVLPGDNVTDVVTRVTKKLKLGAGLKQIDDRVVCVNAGTLRYRPPNKYWVDYNYKRYIPSTDDGVVGIIEDRRGESYTVNIGAPTSATLSVLGFDGASKRNRPNLLKGALIYARVKRVSEWLEPELTCEATAGMTKKDWMTGLSVYGELSNGYVIQCSIGLAKKLLRDDCLVLQLLGKSIPFELAVGVNGRVWINAKSDRDIVVVSNAILNSEYLPDSALASMIHQLLAFRQQN